MFFRQTRVGRDGRPFRIVKFRTMVVGADAMKESLRELNEASGLFKIADDPRITRVGGFVRRTCLDEVPQLFNVLRGEMSLVGPRPLIPEEDCQIVGWQRGRLRTAPGMTGPWQVLGAARIPLQEMVAIDCRYVATWTIWSDIGRSRGPFRACLPAVACSNAGSSCGNTCDEMDRGACGAGVGGGHRRNRDNAEEP